MDSVFVYFSGTYAFKVDLDESIETVKYEIENRWGLTDKYYYMLQSGKLFNEPFLSKPFPLYIVPRLFGGKGGFGSMLRAIGAQIEKTTNREACRDLSGRRLRDINEEKRLKTWIAQQVEREKEANERRQKKLERLVQTPKHEFKDENYEQDRSALPEKVEDALEQGLKASSSGNKRKIVDKTTQKKKARLWMGSDEELSSSDLDSEEENKEENSPLNKEYSDHEQNIPEINKETGEMCKTSIPSSTVTSAVNEEIEEVISEQLNTEDQSDSDKKLELQNAVATN